ADDEQLNAWHERLNVLWRNISSPQVALWTHVIRRRERARTYLQSHDTAVSGDVAQTGFAAHLDARYRHRLARETLMINELYLAIVYRPTSGMATGFTYKALSRTQADGSGLDLTAALEACEKLAQVLQA